MRHAMKIKNKMPRCHTQTHTAGIYARRIACAVLCIEVYHQSCDALALNLQLRSRSLGLMIYSRTDLYSSPESDFLNPRSSVIGSYCS
jgi:hypothetical protein